MLGVIKDVGKAALKGTPLWRASISFVLLAFLVWSFGLGPEMFGGGFALADQEAQIHDELKREISGVKSSVDGLAKQMADSDAERAEKERQDSIRLIRRQIYETERDACAAAGQLRSLLMEQAQALRSDFMKLTGEEYPRLDCSAFR